MNNAKNPLIFIVEDNKIYNQLVAGFLEKKGFTNVKSFSTGEECLKNLNLNPDIIIQDYLLQGMNGIEVLVRAKKHHPETEFIFLSGQDSMEVAVNTMRYGAYDYILKNDMTLDRLADKIGRILKAQKLARKNKMVRSFMLGFIAFLLLVILFFVLYFLTDTFGAHW
jgi:DNA-binding NtrC family response regulator